MSEKSKPTKKVQRMGDDDKGGGPSKNGFYGSTVVGERGQVVIPKEAREKAGLHPGDKLVIFGHGNRLVFAKADELREFARRLLENTE